MRPRRDLGGSAALTCGKAVPFRGRSPTTKISRPRLRLGRNALSWPPPINSLQVHSEWFVLDYHGSPPTPHARPAVVFRPSHQACLRVILSEFRSAGFARPNSRRKTSFGVSWNGVAF